MAEWISMKTPPKETDSYLCALRPVGNYAEKVIMAWAPWEGCRGWYVQDAKGNVKPHKGLPVTHWMPLPDDPPWEEDDE